MIRCKVQPCVVPGVILSHTYHWCSRSQDATDQCLTSRPMCKAALLRHCYWMIRVWMSLYIKNTSLCFPFLELHPSLRWCAFSHGTCRRIAFCLTFHSVSWTVRSGNLEDHASWNRSSTSFEGTSTDTVFPRRQLVCTGLGHKEVLV